LLVGEAGKPKRASTTSSREKKSLLVSQEVGDDAFGETFWSFEGGDASVVYFRLSPSSPALRYIANRIFLFIFSRWREWKVDKVKKNWRVAAAELIPQYLSASSGSSWLYVSFFFSFKKDFARFTGFFLLFVGGAFSSSQLKGLDISPGIVGWDWFALADAKIDNANVAIDHWEMPSIATDGCSLQK
jgi:hypothetical protein